MSVFCAFCAQKNLTYVLRIIKKARTVIDLNLHAACDLVATHCDKRVPVKSHDSGAIGPLRGPL